MLFSNLLITMTLLIVNSIVDPVYTFPSKQQTAIVTSTQELEPNVTSTLERRGNVHPSPQHIAPTLSRQQNTNEGNTYEGDGTFYSPGLGACGHQSSSADLIVAVSHTIYDSYQAGDGSSNALCDKSIRVTHGSKSITVTVVDRCDGCGPADLDFSPAAFRRLSSLNVGRLHDIKWSIL